MISLKDLSIQLKQFCPKIVVDKFLTQYFPFYQACWNEISLDTPPNFGPLMGQEPAVLILIIEELIKREELTYEHLVVLLPREAERLTCDENTEFSIFRLDTIKLISIRCPGFKCLHYHQNILDPNGNAQKINMKLRDSIRLLLKDLEDINFSETDIVEFTILLISTSCPKLKYLNLYKTNLSDGFNYLYSNKSVFINSLTTLIIDEIVPARLVGLYLPKLQNLIHFEYDRTIEACLYYYKLISRKSSIAYPEVEFKTTIFKSRLNIVGDFWTKAFETWVIQRLPKVKRLILISIDEKDIMFVKGILKSLKYVTHLELSSKVGFPFNKLEYVFLDYHTKLISLKLEAFLCVNIYILAKTLRSLKKLTLINNTIGRNEITSSFESLNEVEIVYNEYDFDIKKNLNIKQFMNYPHDDLVTILSSKNLEKVFIYGQSYFTDYLMEELLKNGCLKKLKELCVFISPLGIDGILELFNNLIPIERIEVGFCPNIRVRRANQVINSRIFDYQTSFSVAIEIPYRMKSIIGKKINL